MRLNYSRIMQIHRLREQGKTQAEIGLCFAISKQRVQQILKKYPVGSIPVRFIKNTHRLRFRKQDEKIRVVTFVSNESKHDISTETARNMTGRDYTRELVRTRDNWTCQDCGKEWVKGQRRFDVHHLNGCGMKSQEYDRLETIHELITYCHKCHMTQESVLKKIKEKTGQFKLSRHKDMHPFYR